MRGNLKLAIAGMLAVFSLAPTQNNGALAKPAEETSCGTYGTSVHFEKTPSEAARKALKEEKLVMVLHVSGDFENPEFTWNNAEALRVNALANPEVGKLLNEHFVSSFQRVATFRIVGKQKQGGNVATYFCAPDGRVLHAMAGPVNAQTMLREAKWVVATAEQGIKASKGDGAEFKAYMRKAHAAKLRTEHGLVVEPITFDPPDPKDNAGALTYRDPTGRALAPVLPPAAIDGPDVKFRAMQELSARSAGAVAVVDRRGLRWGLNNQGRVHVLLAAHSMDQLERLYGSVFEGILGERITTKPVEIVDPFPWVARQAALSR